MLFREIAELLVHALFAADEMALDFDVNIFAAEGIDKKLGAIRWTLGSATTPLLNSGSSLHFTAHSPFSLRRCAWVSSSHRFSYPQRSFTSTGNTLPSSIVNSAPTIGRTHCSRAATENRCAP